MLPIDRWPKLARIVLGVALVVLGAERAGAQTLTLPEVIAAALKVTPSLQSATAAQDLSAATVDETRAPLMPNLRYDTEYYQAPGYSPTITNRGQSDTMLVLGYTVFDGGRRLASLRAARFADQAATLGLTAARLQVVFDASLAYYNLLQARQIETELERSRERLERYVRVVTLLRGSGRAIANDVLKIQSARDAAEIAALNARGMREHASVVLGTMIGEFDQVTLEVANLPGLPPPPQGELADSPLLRAAQRQVQSAEAGVAAARAEASPTFTLNLTGGFLGVNPSRTLEHNFGASYDGLISVPLFEGGLIRAHVNQAQARRLAAQANLRQLELDLRQSLNDTLVRYRQAHDELQVIARSLPTANNAFALYWARFLGGGSATLLEVLDAYNQSQDLVITRLQQEFGLRAASAEGKLILGLE